MTKTKKHEQTEKEAVHIEALDVVLEVIYSQVIILITIVILSQLRDISIEKLENKLGLQIPATGVKIYRATKKRRMVQNLNSLRWTLMEKSPLT
jgi:hypothetical protein